MAKIKLPIRKINLLRFFRLDRFEKPSIVLFSFIAFVLINFLSAFLPLRLDFSKGQANTLSKSTKKIITHLDDVINIKFFVSSNLPTRLLPIKTEVVEILNEYQKNSRGKIIVKIIDPKRDEDSMNETNQYGVPELQFSQLEKDKYAVSTAFFGIGVAYGNKKEVIPQVAEPENLEFNLTSLIYKLTLKDVIKIGLIGDQIDSLSTPQDIVSIFKKLASQQFSLESITLSDEAKEISQDIKTLIIIDNQIPYTDQQLSLLKNYLKNGGKAIFFIDGVFVDENLSVNKSNNNLLPLLADYGIKINDNLLLSTSAELVNFGNQMMQFLTPYPFWLKTNNFNTKTAYFANINQLTFPWTSSITLTNKKDIELIELIKTSNKSWEQTESSGYNINPQTIPEPKVSDLKEFIIGAEAKIKNSRLIVVGSSRLIQDQYLNQSSGNLEFVFNLLNDLASQGALTGIRSRAISYYPLPDLSEQQKNIFKYANILGLPILFGLYGAIRLLRRK